MLLWLPTADVGAENGSSVRAAQDQLSQTLRIKILKI
jgi:hypothetical protein